MNYIARLDGRDLISTIDLLIPKNSSCDLDVVVGTPFVRSETTLPLTIVFKNTGGDQNVTFNPIGNRSAMILDNWNSPLGTALNAAIPFADFKDEGTVDLMMASYPVGETSHLTIQLWWRKSRHE